MGQARQRLGGVYPTMLDHAARPLAPPTPPSPTRTTHAAPAAPALGAYVHPVVDAAVIGLGSVAVYLVFRAAPGWAASERVVSFGALMVWIVNYPHFASTNVRLYGSRSSAGQYPVTATLVPLLLVAAMVGSFASPAVIAPAFVMLYQLWSPYHFSGQTIGITMLYARRCDYPIDGWLRRALSTFVVSTFVLQAVRFETGDHDAAFYGVVYPSLGLPGWAPDVAAVLNWTAGATFVAAVLVRTVATRRAMPWILLVPALAQWVWFAAAPAGSYFYLVPFFHSLQYLLVAWNLQLAQRSSVTGAPPSLRFVGRESMRWAAIVVTGGVAMFWLLPRLGAQLGRPLAFSTAIVLAGIQLHHFFVDGVIWRLRHEGVRNPLSSSIPELAGRRSVVTP